MSKRVLFFVGLVVATHQLGCAAKVAVDLDSAVEQLAVADCARESRCVPAQYSKRWTSAAECVSVMSKSRRVLLGTPYVKDPIGFAERCAAALDSDACLYGQPAACKPNTGTQEPGAVCLSGFDCAKGYCRIGPVGPGATPCGVCVAYPEAPSSCSSCRLGVSCVDGACKPPAKASEACSLESSVNACESGLRCTEGRCVPPLPAGAACDPSRDACDRPFDSCDPTTRVCAPLPRAGLGQLCGVTGGGFTLCDPAFTCGGGSICVPRVADGQACNAVSGPGCATSSLCVDGVCRSIDIAMCVKGS